MLVRKKHRYVLVLASKPVQAKQLLDALRPRLGLAYALADLSIIKFFDKDLFAIRCIRGYEGKLIEATALTRSIDQEEIALWSLKTSGTIKSIEEYASKVIEERRNRPARAWDARWQGDQFHTSPQ